MRQVQALLRPFLLAATAATVVPCTAKPLGPQWLPPPGQASWSVASCIEPAQGRICTILVDVALHADPAKCSMRVPDIIEFESATTKIIRLRLRPLSAGAATQITFRSFAFTNGTGADIEPDDEDADADLGKKWLAFRLKRVAGKTGDTASIPFQLMVYTLKLDRTPAGGTAAQCVEQGPAIVNRG